MVSCKGEEIILSTAQRDKKMQNTEEGVKGIGLTMRNYNPCWKGKPKKKEEDEAKNSM